MEYFISLIALAVGAAAGFLISHFRAKSESSRLEERNALLTEQLKASEEKIEKEEDEFEQKLNALRKERDEQLRAERDRASELDRNLSALKAEHQSLQEKLNEQKEELKNMQEQFTTQFENLANRILEEKSEKFTKQNKEQIDQLLNPLGLKLEEFKKKVEETYNEENRQRATLKEQIRQMGELNQRMSEDAKNLTRALKGDSKSQGNWGEMILERILEKSGLVKGREYVTQNSVTTTDGKRLQPDVVVHLPDEKYLIIDSKVSLTAYERYVSSEDDSEANEALKLHINSVRKHVKELSEKNYQQLFGERSPDFVLLFVPIESAFGCALQNDSGLYYEAFERNIVIVSPSTLLATLATIGSIWKQEYQNKNAMEIAKRGGALYDKFVTFTESLDQIGTHIGRLSKSYDDAKGQLINGRGNLVRQAEMLKELGAKASKQIPDSFSPDDDEPVVLKKLSK